MIWQASYFRLFISHVSSSRKGAHGLKEALTPFQIDAFVAHDDIEPSSEWQIEIEEALKSMDAMVAIIRPGFSSSKWCDQEVGFALGSGKFVLPLTKEDTPHGFLAKIQALKVEGLEIKQIAEKISNLMIKKPLPSARMADVLVEGLVNAHSWETARRITKLLEKVPELSSSQLERLVNATKVNEKLKTTMVGTSTAIERIKKLVDDHIPF